MLSKDKIQRINFLAKKKKEKGLTPGEAKEQEFLRQEYLSAVRGQVKATLDNTKFVNEDGKEIMVKHSYKHKNCDCGSGCSCSSTHKNNNSCGCGHTH